MSSYLVKMADIFDEIVNSTEETDGKSDTSSDAVSNERYQYPVKTGMTGGLIEDGDKPWIVGHFSPNAPTDKNHTHHDGNDFKAVSGSPVYPISSGVVLDVGVGQKSGNYIKLSHEDGKLTSFYAHLEKTNVSRGQEVNQKTIIGTVGSTGNARGRGSHLHFELKLRGSLINPLTVIGKPVGFLTDKTAQQIYSFNKVATTILSKIKSST